MELNSKAFANASAAASAVLWIVCSAFVAMLPGMMSNMTGHMLHFDMEPHGWTLTLTGFVFGLIIWCVAAWIAGWLMAFFYNRFLGGTA